MKFCDILNESAQFREYKNSLQNTPISVAGVVESSLAHFIVSSGIKNGTLVVVPNENDAKKLYQDLKFFTERAVYFPRRDYVYYNIDALGHFNEHKRIKALSSLLFKKEESIIVASVDAVTGYTMAPSALKENAIKLKPGKTYDLQELSQKLIKMGYSHDDTVEGCGQFSIRGGIVDIFSPFDDFPYRIEFFDDEVDSVRVYDYVSQRTLNNVDEAVILPCTEAVISDKNRKEILEFIENSIAKLKRKRKNDYTELIKTFETDKELIEQNNNFASIDKYASLIYDKIYTILDFFDCDDVIFVYEPKRIFEQAKTVEWERSENIKELVEKNLIYTDSIELYCSFEEFCKKSAELRHISVNELNHSSISYKYKKLFNFNTKSTVSLHGKIEYLFSDLEKWKKNDTTVVILSSNRGRGENISGILNDKGFTNTFKNEVKEFEKGEITVLCGELKKGFEYPDANFVIIPEKEIFDTDNKRKKRKIENTKRIKSYQDISIGDYVVHQTNGIGIYTGIHKMRVNGAIKDYLKIQYHGTDSLYVPVDQMDMLYKYVGNTDRELKLSKLGTSEWSRTKSKVKKSTKDIAKQLITLYAERSKAQGYSFGKDGPWQRDFEDTFLYEETDDQLRSIEEVKLDMESPRPMDRLLCGDVGYGKTEVAIRAAFKAAVNSKQVAYLCPTTVLAMQHYDTFSKRMEGFAIKTEMLSRFRTPAQQKKILKELKNGTIDIIIGTHRILQDDVEYKDLGLLIIDEEQRFGVTHKEKLKELKKNIDVLSMTATPIPRTLHMSMMNIRDMSVLETPPENRYPVQTFVLEHNEDIIIDAMKRELSRGGQVFYLCNRIERIYSVGQKISKLIPDANVAVGHGRMNESELEDIMYDMVSGKTNILVCTTIIETGLDIPNANTIIIENADKMGLAQLYQLRGRVGRSNRTAYAYLTYKPDLVLSEVAQKRLRAIKEFTEFGSGFKIAMRDLEIRGAGNILGSQQHGHMDSVGYDMYCKLLKESIDEVQGKVVEEEIITCVDFDVDAYIPEKYIENHNTRIEIYKKIASIENEEDAIEIIDELIDRFSNPPKSVVNLVNIATIKSLATKVNITEIDAKKNTVIFKFTKEGISPEVCIKLLQEFSPKLTVSSSHIPTLIYRNTEQYKLFDNIKFILQSIIGLNNDKK